jgi:hypothetical protein
MQEPQLMRIVERITRQMHCRDFCSNSTIKRTHPDTAAHTLLLGPNALLSWAQEVWSSNLHAPTTYFFNFDSFSCQSGVEDAAQRGLASRHNSPRILQRATLLFRFRVQIDSARDRSQKTASKLFWLAYPGILPCD